MESWNNNGATLLCRHTGIAHVRRMLPGAWASACSTSIPVRLGVGCGRFPNGRLGRVPLFENMFGGGFVPLTTSEKVTSSAIV